MASCIIYSRWTILILRCLATSSRLLSPASKWRNLRCRHGSYCWIRFLRNHFLPIAAICLISCSAIYDFRITVLLMLMILSTRTVIVRKSRRSIWTCVIVMGGSMVIRRSNSLLGLLMRGAKVTSLFKLSFINCDFFPILRFLIEEYITLTDNFRQCTLTTRGRILLFLLSLRRSDDWPSHAVLI